MFTNFTKLARFVAAFFACGVLCAGMLFGQIVPTGAGTVTGHVRGPGEVSVPGATVQLTNLKTGERKETWTDDSGNYTFTSLAPGDYRLDVSLVGFRSDSRTPVPVSPDKPLKVNIALVLATPPQAEPKQAQATGRPARSEER